MSYEQVKACEKAGGTTSVDIYDQMLVLKAVRNRDTKFLDMFNKQGRIDPVILEQALKEYIPITEEKERKINTCSKLLESSGLSYEPKPPSIQEPSKPKPWSRWEWLQF